MTTLSGKDADELLESLQRTATPEEMRRRVAKARESLDNNVLLVLFNLVDEVKALREEVRALIITQADPSADAVLDSLFDKYSPSKTSRRIARPDDELMDARGSRKVSLHVAAGRSSRGRTRFYSVRAIGTAS